MRFGRLWSYALFSIVLLPAALHLSSASAEEPPLAYDISWPQCPETVPSGEFAFAIIGLNNGRPFTTNDCFATQYSWAASEEAHPDVYINLDFPKADRPEAANGPYGLCEPADQWCRAYNYGYALARDAHYRAAILGVQPGRYWLDVEMANYWSESGSDNSQVVHGVLDYFDSVSLAVGIYGTSYQWGLLTAGYMPLISRPLWVAGAETMEEALGRCEDASFAFAGGEIWMVQYPEGGFDGNVRCSRAPGRVEANGSATAPASSEPPSRPRRNTNRTRVLAPNSIIPTSPVFESTIPRPLSLQESRVLVGR
ncbi:MAG: hypothetical protein AB7J35_09780 [Dehalococcoidia bacterium]